MNKYYVILFMGVSALFALASLIYVAVDLIKKSRKEDDFE